MSRNAEVFCGDDSGESACDNVARGACCATPMEIGRKHPSSVMNNDEMILCIRAIGSATEMCVRDSENGCRCVDRGGAFIMEDFNLDGSEDKCSARWKLCRVMMSHCARLSLPIPDENNSPSAEEGELSESLKRNIHGDTNQLLESSAGFLWLSSGTPRSQFTCNVKRRVSAKGLFSSERSEI